MDTIRFPDLKGLVAKGHSLGLQMGFYLNTCICMEKGAAGLHFEEDVAFLVEHEFDTVKIDQCGQAMDMAKWAALINATGRKIMLENCHNRPYAPSINSSGHFSCPMNM